MPRLYDRSFALAFTSQAVFALANMLMAHYARWIGFLGGGVAEVGWIIGVGSLAGLVLRPWMAQCIDRLGLRSSWALGYAVFGGGVLGSFFLHELSWAVYLYRSCLMLGPAVVFATGITYVTAIFPDSRRTEAIGIMGASGLCAMFIGPFLGDLILGIGPEPRTRDDFSALFLASLILLVIPFTCLVFVRPPDTRNRTAFVGLGSFVRTVRQHWPGGILLVGCIHGIYMSVPFWFLPKYIDDAGIFMPGQSELGVFFMAYAGLALALRVILRQVPDQLGRRKVLLVGLCLCGSAAFSLVFVDPAHPWLPVVSGLLGGSGHALTWPPLTSLAIERFPQESRGAGVALCFLVVDVGNIAGAPLLGHLAEDIGWLALFVTASAACFVSASFFFCVSVPVWRQRARDREAERIKRTRPLPPPPVIGLGEATRRP